MSFDKKEYQKEIRGRRKAAGICIRCGKMKAVPGRTCCAECKKKERERYIEDYRFYREKGICVRCHRAKAEPGRVLCWICLERNKKYSRDKKALKAVKEEN